MLILGGSGFVGQHLRRVAAGTQDVTVVRRDLTAPWNRLSPDELEISEVDFRGQAGDDAIRRARSIVYLSTRSVPGVYEATPWLELERNVQPALEFFMRCVRLNPEARILITSSGGTIYGTCRNVPIDETTKAVPISAYGFGKLAIEQAAAYVANSTGAATTILRLSNPVGVFHRNKKQGLVPAAVNAVRSGEPLTLYGDDTVRDYVDADEVGDAILKAALDTSSDSLTVNIGSGRGSTVREVIDQVSFAAGKEVPTILLERRPHDVPYVVLDCSLAAERLQWRANTTLGEMVSKYWSGTQPA